MPGREPLLMTAVGKKGVGKSVESIRMLYDAVNGNISKGVKPRKALIFDVNDEFGDFWFNGDPHHKIKAISLENIPRFVQSNIYEIRRIRPFHNDGRKMSLDEQYATLGVILELYNSGMLMVEDPNKYMVSGNMKKDVFGELCTARHSEMDLLMHYQTVKNISSSSLLSNTNYIRFHKVNETVAKHRDKLVEKTELLQLAESMVNKYYYNGDKRFYVFVNIDESKIEPGFMGFKPEDVDEAIRDVISMNYNELIKPVTNQIDFDSGQKIYTPKMALKMVANRLKKTYF